MKKVFLLFAAMMTATVFNLSADGMDTLYLNTGGSTLWNQGGAKFSAFYWNDGVAGKFTDFLELAYGETDIYRAIIPKSDSVIFVRHAATADVPTWDNKLHYTGGEEINLEDDGNMMLVTGWGPTDRQWDDYWYTPKQAPDMHDYLHFVSLKASGSVKMSKQGTPAQPVLEYSKDNRKSWSNFDLGNGTTFDHVGDTIWFRAGKNGVAGTNATISSSMQNYFTFAFGENDSIAAGGNIMSLYDASCEQTTMTNYGFVKLFQNAKQLVSAPELPATQLAEDCYYQMFSGCTALTAAPKMKATTSAKLCCYAMFNGCTSLIQAPELKATTLAENCYSQMFYGCTSLTQAPALPATKLAELCYTKMFYGCTSLVQAPELKATTLANFCYMSMFQGCTSLQVDAFSTSCDGAELVVPDVTGDAPDDWNYNMFNGCHGTAANNIQLGGHYCMKEYKEIVCQIGSKGYESITAAVADVKAGDIIQVLKDIQLDAMIIVYPKTPAFTLDLNGHILNGSNLTGNNTSLIYDAGTLSIIDSDPTATHAAPFDTIQGAIMTGGKGYYYAGHSYGGAICASGLLNVDGVVFVNNTASLGGAVYLEGATSIIKHCRFYGNTSNEDGAAISVNTNSQCNIDSCVIKGNFNKTGTICADHSTLTIAHTTITDNTSSRQGGGISIQGVNLTLNDGTVITNNTSKINWQSGGVYVWEQSGYNNTITLSGKVIIKDNTTNGKAANFCLSGFPTCASLALNGLSAGSEIHVCTMSNDVVVPSTFATNATEADLQYFVSDNGFAILRENNKLVTKDTLDYLHFVSLKDNGTVKLNKHSNNPTTLAWLTAKFEYSMDRRTWKDYTWNEKEGATIALPNAGDTVFFRAKGEDNDGKNAKMSVYDVSFFYFVFGSKDSIAAGGNVMSLYDAKCEQDTMTNYGFYCLFNNASQLVSAPKLPATKLANSCYARMFYGCTSLTQIPELKVTTLEESCYYGMFSGCTALTTAPALPATTLAKNCYESMFSRCTALTQVPELKATTLAMMCYAFMFEGCTALAVDTLSSSCSGAELAVPSPESAPEDWNMMMFDGCHGAYANNIKLGGHYCIKEFIPDTIKGIELVAVDTQYDGQNHNILVNGTIAGDKVTYSTDSATWKQDTIKLKNVAEQTVYVRIRRTDHIDWGGKSSIKIAKKVLTVDSVIIAEKVYDGTFTATVKSSKLVGVVKGESVGLDVRGDFNDKNAGKDKDVTVEYRLEGGEEISNYTLQKESETVKGTITPKTLTVTGTTASEKEYDGNTTASVTAGTLSGVVESDDVHIDTATGKFENKNAGENKNVITTYTLRGSDADNYTTGTDTILANITPKQLTISGTTIADKTYDGMYNADVDVLGTVEGIVAGETVKVTATAYFNDKDAGEGKDVSVEYSVEGEGYTNYQAPQASYHTANINKRPITITSGSAAKIFDNMPLTNNKVEVTEGSWAEYEGASLDAKGSQTQVGSSPNSFDITCYGGTDKSNYDITIVEGTLTVKDYGTCAEANATPVDEVVGLKPVVVTYVNNAYTYVKDATGASLIYADDYGLNAGDQVTGFTGESAPDEYGLPRIFPSKKSSELTIVAGAAPEPELRTATPTMNEIHQYVRYEKVKIDNALLTLATPVEATLNNGDQILLDSKFGSSYLLEGGEDITYDIVAIVGVRDEVIALYPTVIAIHASVNLSDVNADNRVVEKYVKDGQLYIRVNGVVYDAAGARVR